MKYEFMKIKKYIMSFLIESEWQNIKSNIIKVKDKNVTKYNINNIINNIKKNDYTKQCFINELMLFLKNGLKYNKCTITEHEWVKYYKQLLYDEKLISSLPQIIDFDGLDNINIFELNILMEKCKLIQYDINLQTKLLNLFNECWKYKKIPDEWLISKIKSIHKNGDKNICNNYRGINLINWACKLYSKILNNRLKPIMENLISEEQSGFRKNRSIKDNIYILHEIIRNRKKETYFAFIDFKKAFDNVDREILWNIMHLHGYPPHLINAIKSLYENTRIIVKSKVIKINKGIKQGCAVSLSLFNIYIDHIMNEWKQHNIKGIELNDNTNLNYILYADDLVIISTNKNDFIHGIDMLNNLSKKYKLPISFEKTKVMAFKGTETINIEIYIDDNLIQQVDCFTYLGYEISYTNKINLLYKLNQFDKICNLIINSLKDKVDIKIIIHVYKILAVPIFTSRFIFYELSSEEENIITRHEMHFLKNILDFNLEDDIIRQILDVYKLVDKINESKYKWKERLSSMDYDRLPMKIVNFH
ncbi:Reverse transcriptase [Melanoplus sanguinipes entomopoxvirus]|uniref:ORF MSV061 putative LINE reverse transcriptase, similar to Caenorhabditis elegans GB:U00063 n=1 Tax=Melanoplus sanguinipes entomopoxvirus TaxID=83191 RepID=Q9YW31_MSEPV|nr:Reverse transcriptase [Melanoplus sanguinipes entomopoxvirus]AAC97621.1 ORF MSV061 putative LINE reverse transcriptase, similar to Caenorhabditis elegans GB:U00063 [Melanoplus sanguinipes entomopoxvirus 'O']